MSQLILPLGSNPRHTFANFCATGNPGILEVLESLPQEGGSLWLHGSEDSGKTHLLQAVCHQAKARDQSAAYLPLKQMRELGPEALDGLEQCMWVCLDDIDAVLGQEDWEQRLFGLVNQTVDHGASLLMAARRSAASVPVKLPDLQSRLRGAVSFPLQPLDDDEQTEALRRRARSQGYELPEDAVRYMQRHVVRGLGQLCRVLDRLEQASLSQQRRITVPFVREVLDQPPTSEGRA